MGCGQFVIDLETNNAQQLAALIEPTLREVDPQLGPTALARAAAHAIIHRHDEPGVDHA
ncbi:hypothetical protein [Streptomyces sp. NPDC051994]|uniref:hypothetical protein n=1 Tax=unclassified Streptomyces TaxID=2593676 RepID=UPI0034376CAC